IRRGSGLWRGWGELATVAEQGPDEVDQSAGQGDQGLGVALPHRSFALAVGAGEAVESIAENAAR
ncbi:MAG: hypothetical protein JWR58_2106, partial [Pseudonocardia sp.]|nr:hypothetical protein [Pseudonocardia sp.]